MCVRPPTLPAALLPHPHPAAAARPLLTWAPGVTTPTPAAMVHPRTPSVSADSPVQVPVQQQKCSWSLQHKAVLYERGKGLHRTTCCKGHDNASCSARVLRLHSGSCQPRPPIQLTCVSPLCPALLRYRRQQLRVREHLPHSCTRPRTCTHTCTNPQRHSLQELCQYRREV